MIPAEAVEAAARVAYAARPAKYYIDGSVVTWERLGDPRGGQLRKDQELSIMRAALEAAAPHLMAAAWDEGFRRGNFWHGWILEPTTFAPDFSNPHQSDA